MIDELLINVRNAVDNRPLQGVTVTLTSLRSTEVTDSEGRVTFRDLVIGDYVTVEAEKADFEKIIFGYTVKEEEVQVLNLGMSPDLSATEVLRAVLTWTDEKADLDFHAVEVNPDGPQIVCEVSYL